MINGVAKYRVLLSVGVKLLDVRFQSHGADKLFETLGADVDEGVFPDVQLEGLILGGSVVTQLARERSLVSMNQHVSVSFQLVFELALADVTVVQELSLSLSGQ